MTHLLRSQPADNTADFAKQFAPGPAMDAPFASRDMEQPPQCCVEDVVSTHCKANISHSNKRRCRLITYLKDVHDWVAHVIAADSTRLEAIRANEVWTIAAGVRFAGFQDGLRGCFIAVAGVDDSTKFSGMLLCCCGFGCDGGG